MKEAKRKRFPLDPVGEETVMEETDVPRTRESLAHDLRKLGLKEGMSVEVHSSLSKIGWVCGGAVAVIGALMDVVTPEGTLLMPTQTYRCSDPTTWFPRVPAAWLDPIRETLPAFDPLATPSELMGQIAETFRTWPNVIRSAHPTVSFASWGKHATLLTTNHSLDYGLGEQSPLARLYDLDGYVLLLGVGYRVCTSLHLAEYRAKNPKQITRRSPLLENGKRVWRTYQDIELDSTQFSDIGCEFEWQYEKQDLIKEELVGSAITRFFPQRQAVDAGVAWINRYNGTRQ